MTPKGKKKAIVVLCPICGQEFTVTSEDMPRSCGNFRCVKESRELGLPPIALPPSGPKRTVGEKKARRGKKE